MLWHTLNVKMTQKRVQWLVSNRMAYSKNNTFVVFLNFSFWHGMYSFVKASWFIREHCRFVLRNITKVILLVSKRLSRRWVSMLSPCCALLSASTISSRISAISCCFHHILAYLYHFPHTSKCFYGPRVNFQLPPFLFLKWDNYFFLNF